MSGVARRAELQTTAPLRNNQDQIYFADPNWRNPTNDRVTTEKSGVDVQMSVEFKSQVDKNFLQTVPTPGYPTAVTQNSNIRPDLQRVYLQLQPALFLNDPYFFGNRFHDSIEAFRPIGPMTLHNQVPVQNKLTQVQSDFEQQKGQSQVFNQQVQPVRPFNNQTPVKQQNSQSLEQNNPITGHNAQIPSQIQNTPVDNAPVSRAVANFGLNLLRVRLNIELIIISKSTFQTVIMLLK